MTSNFFKDHLGASPVIAILRGLSPSATTDMAEKCWDNGIHLVEVPAQSDDALQALKAASKTANDSDRLIGAGTICAARDVVRAHDAGARFLVSPGFFPESIERADELQLPYLPGVATPTEMYGALSMSLTVQKLFPAHTLGPSSLKTLHGPFPQIAFVAVGGVTPTNANEFIEAGAIGIGVGNALSDQSALNFFSSL